MRCLFPEIDPMGRAGGFGMIFAETHVRFASPGFYEEDLRVDVRPIELRRSSVRIAFEIVCEGDGRLVAEGWGTLVGYDYEQGRAAPFPEPIAARLRAESVG
jgi:acyl-CoA thioester hydrolase